jgi:hypothetical protein
MPFFGDLSSEKQSWLIKMNEEVTCSFKTSLELQWTTWNYVIKNRTVINTAEKTTNPALFSGFQIFRNLPYIIITQFPGTYVNFF